MGTEKMMADMMTKPVTSNKLKICCDGVGLA